MDGWMDGWNGMEWNGMEWMDGWAGQKIGESEEAASS